jgi:hypothetical protein
MESSKNVPAANVCFLIDLDFQMCLIKAFEEQKSALYLNLFDIKIGFYQPPMVEVQTYDYNK